MGAENAAHIQCVHVLGAVSVVAVDRQGHLALLGVHARDVRGELIGAGLHLLEAALVDGHHDALFAGQDAHFGAHLFGFAGGGHRTGHAAGGTGSAGRAASGQHPQSQNACKEHQFLVVRHINTFFPLQSCKALIIP